MANLFGCDFSIGAEHRLPDPVAAPQGEPAEAGIRALPAFDAALDMSLGHQAPQHRHFEVEAPRQQIRVHDEIAGGVPFEFHGHRLLLGFRRARAADRAIGHSPAATSKHTFTMPIFSHIKTCIEYVSFKAF
jgi:hypothetical protein